MNNSESYAQGSRCYEQLNIVDGINNKGSHELKPLDAMSSSGLWMIWMTLCHELKAMDNMNDSGSWAHSLRYYEHVKVVVDMNDFRSWA